MKKINIGKSLLRNCLMILLLLILTSAISIMFILYTGRQSNTYSSLKTVKVNVNEALSFMEDNFDSIGDPSVKIGLSDILKKDNLEAVLLDVEGRILFSSSGSIAAASDETVNIKYVNLEDSYHFNCSSPVLVNNKVVGNSIFSLPRDMVSDNSGTIPFYMFLPLIAGIASVLFMILHLYLFTVRNLLVPVKELNHFASSVSKGNFTSRLTFETDSEVTEVFSALQLMQEELKYSLQRQMDMEKERREFIACISHDLRTPLSSIKAYAGAIKDGFAKSAGDLTIFSGIIDSKADSISKLIDDFFEQSKAELGQLKINKRPIYSKELILKVYEAHKFEFMKRGQSFILMDNLPEALIDADPLRLEQVLFNLLLNAGKYTPEGGTVQLGVFSEASMVKFFVKDNGIGISSFDMPYIFEKFFRGEKSNSPEYIDGSGLGLAICKYIVKAHNGQIYAESSSGSGSTFYFTIPKA
ncbi:MAG: HAMP domain-containing sensor histidine kinase [Bacillota bacterium]|nr:HAMP domain-containing sensor histidine kinase [Bacillota bacterium]